MFTAAILASLTNIWFFADFDRPAMLAGNAFECRLTATGDEAGRYGRGYRFHHAVSNLLRADQKLDGLPGGTVTGRVVFVGGTFTLTNRTAGIRWSHVRPTAGSTWSFYVKGRPGTEVKMRVALSAPTEKTVKEAAKKYNLKPEGFVKETAPEAVFALTGGWQRVWAFATADNRISQGRGSALTVTTTGPVEMERFQLEPSSYYPCNGDFSPGLWVRGGTVENAQLMKCADTELLKDFPYEKGATSVWVKGPDIPEGVWNVPIWGLNRSWSSDRGFTLNSLRTDAKCVVSARACPPKMRDCPRANGDCPHVARDCPRVNGACPREGGWHHFAASWDGAQIVLWRDGVRIAEGEQKKTDSPDGRPRTLRIGGFADGDATSEAVLDEIAIFNRPITDEEVKTIFRAKEGLLGGGTALVGTPILFKVFARNQANAALRRRLYVGTPMTCRLHATVGGYETENREVALCEGWNELAVSFDPAQYRPGEYEYDYVLTDASGRRVFADRGTLTIRGRVERDRFMVHDWGGFKGCSKDFLHGIGVDTLNVSSFAKPRLRQTVEDGFFVGVRYENSAPALREDWSAAEIADRAERDLAFLKGNHWWQTTLVNSEVYGSGSLEAVRDRASFNAGAEKALGFRPDWSVKHAPTEILWKQTGIAPQRGIVKDEDVHPAIRSIDWFMTRGMPALVATAAAREGIHRVDPSGIVWSEPSVGTGVARASDMLADWEYAGATADIAREVTVHWSSARAMGRPFMPTLWPYIGYHHGWSGTVKGADGKPVKLTSSEKDFEVKAWIVLAGSAAHGLSLFSAEDWELGVRDAKAYLASPTNGITRIAEPDTVEKFGAFMREKYLPAAMLLRDVPNVRAPIAFAPSKLVEYAGGYWWGWTHFNTACEKALQRLGIPWDYLRDEEQTVETLAAYRAVLAPMRCLVSSSEHAAYAVAAKRGTEILLDTYAAKDIDYPGATRLDAFKYEGALVNRPGGFRKMGEPLFACLESKKAELRKRLYAWSEQDGESAFTFVKEWKGVKYVVVVNDGRSEERGIFGNFCTNAAYRPLLAAQRIVTHVQTKPGDVVYAFNDDGRHVKVADGVIEKEYAPGEAVVYCVHPRRIQKMTLELGGELTAGRSMTLKIGLSDEVGTVPGRQVVRLELVDGDGNVRDESGLYAVEGGCVEIPLRIPRDEKPTGFFSRWKATVTDLVSGQSESIRLTIKSR